MEYDSMIDDNPIVQERVAKSRAEGELQVMPHDLLVSP